jgi:hypothetical protein
VSTLRNDGPFDDHHDWAIANIRIDATDLEPIRDSSSICDITRTERWQFELQRKPYLCGRDGFNSLTEITLGAMGIMWGHLRASLRYDCSSVSNLPHYKWLREAPAHSQKALLEDQLE